MSAQATPKLAVWKFASCDGCQLSLLDLEDDLLALAGAVQLADFREAGACFPRLRRRASIRSITSPFSGAGAVEISSPVSILRFNCSWIRFLTSSSYASGRKWSAALCSMSIVASFSSASGTFSRSRPISEIGRTSSA